MLYVKAPSQSSKKNDISDAPINPWDQYCRRWPYQYHNIYNMCKFTEQGQYR